MSDQQPTSREIEQGAEKADVAAAQATWSHIRAILRVIFVTLIVAAALWLLYALQGGILLLVLSMFFAYLIAPLVEIVRRPILIRGCGWMMPRAIAIGIVYSVLFGLRRGCLPVVATTGYPDHAVGTGGARVRDAFARPAAGMEICHQS